MLKVALIMVGLIVGSSATASLESKEAVAKPELVPIPKLPKLGEGPNPKGGSKSPVEPKPPVVTEQDTADLFTYLHNKFSLCRANTQRNLCCQALWRFIWYNGSALCAGATHDLSWFGQTLTDVVQHSCQLPFACAIIRVPYNGVPYNGVPHSRRQDTDDLFYFLQNRWKCPALWNPCCQALWTFIWYNGSALCADATNSLNWPGQKLTDVVLQSCNLPFACAISRVPSNGVPYNGVPSNGVPYNGVPHSRRQTLAIPVFFIPSTLLLLLM